MYCDSVGIFLSKIGDAPNPRKTRFVLLCEFSAWGDGRHQESGPMPVMTNSGIVLALVTIAARGTLSKENTARADENRAARPIGVRPSRRADRELAHAGIAPA